MLPLCTNTCYPCELFSSFFLFFSSSSFLAKSNQTNVTLTQFDRVVQRERVALARLREEIAKDVTLWTEIMEGRLDNRNAAHILELAVSSYEAPHRWREWGGDWILASEMNEFLELLKERQLYWKNSFVQNERKVWWGALSRPASLLGVVVFDSGERILNGKKKNFAFPKRSTFFF